MKVTTFVLVSSLTLNALLLAWVAGRTPRESAVGGARAGSATSFASLPAAATLPATGHTAQSLLALEPAALRAALQRLKLPREVVDALVVARVYSRHDARRRELMLETSRLPWWQTVTASVGRLSLLTPEQRKELRHLDAVARSDVIRLLGPEALDRDGAITARYSYVPAERAIFLEAIVRDYQDIGALVREDMRGLRTAVDREHEAFVEAERQRDLARLLAPPEREIFELRTSVAGEMIRGRLVTFEASEEEYRAVFAVYRDFHAKHPGSVTVDGQVRPGYFGEYPEYEQKIREVLGEARYADWALAGASSTQSVVRLAPELGLSPAAVRETAQLLRETAARSWAIGEGWDMTNEQKRAALATLVATTRNTLATKLGGPGSEALLRATPWIDTIASGHSVKIDLPGTSWTPVGSVSRSPRPAGNAGASANSAPAPGTPAPRR